MSLVEWTGCNFGGRRPWFGRPNTRCERRVEKLYLLRTSEGPAFVCRRGADLCATGRSVRTSTDASSLAALIHDPIDVRVTGGHPVFTFPDGLFGMPRSDRLYVLRLDGTFLVYDAESGHCRSAQLGPTLRPPMVALHEAWEARGAAAQVGAEDV